MSAKKVLISGFEPFGGAKLNPSQLLVEQLAKENIPGVDLRTIVLPVEFDQAAKLLLAEIEKVSPDVVVAFGQAEGRSAITPEKIAINLDDARIPDNSGDQRQSRKIAEDGADGYFSTLPIEKIVDSIKQEKISSSVSLSAGAFVCNHVFYVMQHQLLGSTVKSGFVHVPLVAEQATEFPNQPTVTLDELVRGAKAVILSTL
jgi:pyroglutamyl-peptidase